MPSSSDPAGDDASDAAFVVGPAQLAAGADDGPLAGTTAAVKDVLDVAGVPTTAGNPDWAASHPVPTVSATAVARLLAAGATVVGKTVTDELAFSLSGTNVHHGTPPNPAAPGRVPGGSSAGSASAVAAGQADIGLGTDTAGSIRVPASYCGLYGVRPTWGRVPSDGCVPLAPRFDTVGWLTRSAALAAAVGAVLLDPPGGGDIGGASSAGGRPGGDATPAGSRGGTPGGGVLIVARDAFALLDDGLAERMQPPLAALAALFDAVHDEELAPPATGTAPGGLAGWAEAFRLDQARQVWRTHGAWITERAPRFGPGVAARFGWAATVSDDDVARTEPARRAAIARLDAVLSGAVLCIPAASGPPPRPDADAASKDSLRLRTVTLTCIAGLIGAPAVTIPALRTAEGPVGLCLVAAPGRDEQLLELAVRHAAGA